MSNIVNLFGAPIEAPQTEEKLPLLAAAIDATKTQDYAGRSHDFFEVEKKPISGPYGDIPNRKGIFCDEQCINVVSNGYEIHQPIEIYNKFAERVDSHNLTINRVLNNPKNGGLLLSAKFANTKIMGEEHDINLTFYTSHCGKYRTFLSVDLLCIPCFNQIPTLYKNSSRFIVAEKHYKNALDIDAFDQALTNIPQTVLAYNEKAEALKDFHFTYDDFVQFYIESYKVDVEAKRFDKKVEALKNIYYNGANQKSYGPNALKAFQAITFMNTHELKDTAMKQENMLIKGGNDSLKQMERLLVLAA